MRASIFVLVLVALISASSHVSAQVSISDVISVIQLIRDWARDNKPAQPAQPTHQHVDNSVYFYYKWVGTYDYLIDGNTALFDCRRYIPTYMTTSNKREKHKFLLFVVLVQNRADSPIYVQPGQFYLHTYATDGERSGDYIPMNEFLCVEPPWGERDQPPNAPWFIKYHVAARDIPIIKQNRFSGGLLRPGQEISGQIFMTIQDDALHNMHSFEFGYDDGRHAYKDGEFLAGSNIRLFYRNISG